MAYSLSMKKTTAIYAFRGPVALAKAIGVSRSAVYQWPEVIPEPRAAHIREVARKKGVVLRTPPKSFVWPVRRKPRVAAKA